MKISAAPVQKVINVSNSEALKGRFVDISVKMLKRWFNRDRCVIYDYLKQPTSCNIAINWIHWLTFSIVPLKIWSYTRMLLRKNGTKHCQICHPWWINGWKNSVFLKIENKFATILMPNLNQQHQNNGNHSQRMQHDHWMYQTINLMKMIAANKATNKKDNRNSLKKETAVNPAFQAYF